MTTKVTVSAHLADDKEVHVLLNDGNSEDAQLTVLQNGQSVDLYVYDAREISVKEVQK
jgi:hypothetical protein